MNVFFFISANKSKVYYGIPPEPDLGVVIEEESEEDDDKDKPKVYTYTCVHKAVNPSQGFLLRAGPVVRTIMSGSFDHLVESFFFACIWTETESRSINSQKRKKRTFFIICLSGKCFLWNTVDSPDWTRWGYLACSGSQSQHRI